jgi:ribonuclease Z
MRNLVRALVLVAAGIAIAGALAYAFRVDIGRALFARLVSEMPARNSLAALPDGLHVVLCGSGSPLPDPTRRGPCTAVVAGQRLFIVDAGGGAVRNLGTLGLPAGAIEAVLLTHFHSDHIDGLGELLMLRWTSGGHRRPLPVFGPPGVESVVAGLRAAYSLDSSYRVAHHGASVVPPGGAGGEARPFTLAADTQSAVIVDGDGLRIIAFAVEHAPVAGAVGYRFDYGGRSVVVSGDTTAAANLVRHAAGADLLVHEALNREMVALLGDALGRAGNARAAKIFADIQDYHASPVEAAQAAAQAGVRALVLTHIVPPLPQSLLEPYFLDGAAEAFAGPITLGRDGMLFSLPAGSQEIRRGSLP